MLASVSPAAETRQLHQIVSVCSMTRIDRYILRVFFRTLLITFVSLTGIFIVIHAFNNLEELEELGRSGGGWSDALLRYYGPHALIIFDWTCPILVLLAVLFTLGWLRRNGELTPLLASGIGYGRLLKPLIGASVLIVVLGTLNRETLLPMWRDSLGVKPQELAEKVERAMQPCFDRSTGILINGKQIVVKDEEIIGANFLSRTTLGSLGTNVSAHSARYRGANEDRPAGYLLEGVIESPASRLSSDDVLREGEVLIYMPDNHAWLRPGQCFIRSAVAFELLRSGSTAQKLAGTFELVRRMQNSSVHVDADTRMHTHGRFSRPLLDLCLLMLGLPIAVGRDDRNLFVVAGYGLLIVLVFYAIKTAATTLGSFGYVENTALAAWVPFLILGPIAYVRYRTAAEK